MITVHRIYKSFLSEKERSFFAVEDVNFMVSRGQLFTLLGPSGCGKTTTLRCVAGLEYPDSGEISIGGQTVFSARHRIQVPVNQRKIGMVFQSYAIWPHMTVFENVAYPLKMRRFPRKDIRERTYNVLEMVGLKGMENRAAPHLSGGQQQRVAFARALVAEPEVLLLDEPLSNLDAKLREEMRWELKDLQNRLGITTLYVTHDQAEALALSDQIAVMHEGKLVEIGKPRAIYEHPRAMVTACFIGMNNRIPGIITGRDGGLVQVECSVGKLWSKEMNDGEQLSMGEKVEVFLRPENFIFSPPEGANSLQGTILRVSYLGENMESWIKVGETEIRVSSHPKYHLEPGGDILIGIAPEDCWIVPLNDGIKVSENDARPGRACEDLVEKDA